MYVALGSNIGNREGHLAYARSALASLPGTSILGASQIAETVPVGPVEQPPFLNQMVLLITRMSPHGLLDACLAIERAAGRVRGERWGPRTLDLDIVRFGSREISDPQLEIPHPELANRDWWQDELRELGMVSGT